MSAPPGSSPAAGATEVLSAAQFQDALRQVIRYRQQLPVDDPLASTVKSIEQNPAFSQSRLLTRVLDALAYQRGEFRRAEIDTLDAQTLAMVITLIDAYAAGTVTRVALEHAVAAVKAAELGA
ncbi:MAG: hypothetical protein A3G25_07540 [Betaproteobacteria bacterium RIFCSPLOWO2_12_FULL_63_13]|nr:MAG: hypothetical protein A3G25_07540 [Betaproteobacteria bacterium RIFCSPLOWO2_12_FULL_63_13]